MALRNYRARFLFIFLVFCCSLYYLYHSLELYNGKICSLSIFGVCSRENFDLCHMRREEFRFKEKLKSLAASELENFNKMHHRNVSIHWGSTHGLLPQGKPPPHISCLRHLDTAFNTSVSIVMCMRNELVYLLLRTLTTIVRRTPENLLHEIVLIDDGSDEDSLPEVRTYCSQLNLPLRTFRNNESVGITSCRRFGIEQAKGDVIVLLDSHMEVSDLWLEPLLDILMSKPGAIAVPTLHLINEKEYEQWHQQVCEAYGIEAVAGYSYFRYYSAGPPDKNQSAPYLTASVLGGGLAAYRSTFLRLFPQTVFGELWGTENTRLAIRAWVCGEGLWMTRCSQILHTNGNDGELKRYTSTSPDMRKHLQYETVGDILNFIDGYEEETRFLQSVYSDDNEIEVVRHVHEMISSQFNVADQCSKDYHWYLRNIFPSSHNYLSFLSPEYTHVGEVQSVAVKSACLRAANKKVSAEGTCRKEKTAFYDTHLIGVTSNGDIHMTVFTLFCFDSEGKAGNGAPVMLHICHTKTKSYNQTKPGGTQNFVFDEEEGQIRHVTSGTCLQLEKERYGVVLWKCDGSLVQKWKIKPARWTVDKF